jgi:phosphohistidine phosphatase
MARQLWLLRHADAEPHGTRVDAERMLTDRGRSQARVAGHALATMQAGFDAIATSPKVRACQTAEIALAEWPPAQRALLSVDPALAGGFSTEHALALVAHLSEDARVLLVGHEPDFSSLVATLTGASIDLKKGGLAAMRLHGDVGELVLLLRPRELAGIAGDVAADL